MPKSLRDKHIGMTDQLPGGWASGSIPTFLFSGQNKLSVQGGFWDAKELRLIVDKIDIDFMIIST